MTHEETRPLQDYTRALGIGPVQGPRSMRLLNSEEPMHGLAPTPYPLPVNPYPQTPYTLHSTPFTQHPVQGYLAHKKHPSHRSLQ